MSLKSMTTVLVLTLAAGCGGGGGSSETPPPARDRATKADTSDKVPTTPRQEATEDTASPDTTEGQIDGQLRIRDRAEALLSRYEGRIAQARFTDPDALPATGSATYEGVAGWSLGGDPLLSDVAALEAAEMLSRLELDVDFRDSALSGKIDDVFEVRSGKAYAGDLSIAGDLRRGTDPSQQAGLRARAQGDLRGGDQTLNLDLEMSGDALADGAAVAGQLTGVARNAGRVQTVQGGFVADR
ncbi:hypothetical protein EU805_05905 [Salipiger sp. IMCC34102]|uniref:hypothetical protein n=1 Tax=Salipiger sp. IMCC34102 TaxID=2510647 RepID=UPI00101D180A|nr:hypothetical protein [Salipiger sp. IMCC34102]RYH03256.1 hypothetical protein EU805_05905 [Salipiger sp. IMCC34102]